MLSASSSSSLASGNDEGSSSNRRRKGKHPSHLQGRDIGLFYAERSRKRKERKDPLRVVIRVSLSNEKKRHIQNTLKKLKPLIEVVSCKSHNNIKDSLFKREFLNVVTGSITDNLPNENEKLENNESLNDKLHGKYKEQVQKYDYMKMLHKREALPSFRMKGEVLDAIETNQVVLISGETGCGKTTQIPQFILDDFLKNQKGSVCRIICTQPRRISAISVAERVACERAEKLGESVGYHIRLEKRLPRSHGSILFVTTGIILKQMEVDPYLSSISHIILDEIHERDTMIDFLMALLKKIMQERKDLKVILMSATLNSAAFSHYFDNCPHINIPGLTFPVKEYFLEDVIQKTGFCFPDTQQSSFKKIRDRQFKQKAYEYMDFIKPFLTNNLPPTKYDRNVIEQLRNPKSEDFNYDLIVDLIVHICHEEQEPGAILVFVSGFSEINTLSKKIGECHQLPRNRLLVIPLHSQLPTIEQKEVFEVPPLGIRKIVLATNIAETSITIDDIVYVIDCGFVKMKNFISETNTATLKPERVSQANALQRRGRAGRTKPGVCYHLYTRARYDVMEHYTLPEILRTRLEVVILEAKILRLGDVKSFFGELMDPPSLEAVTLSLNLLRQINALDDEEVLTPLGYHLAKLPISPQLGKMILFGAIFGCLDPILSIAACLDWKDPFQLPMGKEREADMKRFELSEGVKSDYFLFHKVIKLFEAMDWNEKRRFCFRNFLSLSTMNMLINLKKQYAEYLLEMEFVTNTNYKNLEWNMHSDNGDLVSAVVCAGLYPNIAYVLTKRRGRAILKSPENCRFELHPKSVLSKHMYFSTNFLIYYQKIKSSKEFLHDASTANTFPVILFGNNFSQEVGKKYNKVVINNMLKFGCSPSTSGIIDELRKRLDDFLSYKISHPSVIRYDEENEQTMLLKTIIELLVISDDSLDESRCEDVQ